ncbi:enoyl-CoA hydratase/isomerase family protein [Roseomonas sp. NAR14]|uniref:Enoyl-CoA hydratase/isomerase family protein n=1 Tax=Roseomonas acroporae TaxID=2937791 RepID=A0A9X1Y5I7_9PROT|nr:enoyl-CoA hydratase/isomerase family protein [Roseomonas acroporae]MCK8783487.1 enoyl-CoA hydratase/isomerase family protein [Roseomonas acroporae]
MSETETTLQASREGAAGLLLMNRPRALNALDQSMIDAFAAAIAAWRDDPSIRFVLLEGAGGRAFCAGGDVRRIRQLSLDGDTAGIEAFFAGEYGVNAGIADFGKPWISLIDGVCMGGGIGVSVHGSHRVVTEHALLAMPETAIALFPDVGTSHVLPRLRATPEGAPGALGNWLAMTGARLAGAEAVSAGLATHYVPRGKLPALREALLREGPDAIGAFAESPPPPSFADALPAIDRCFGAPTVPAILDALEHEDSEWARAQIDILRRMSPTSLFVTRELLRRGAGMDLAGCLAMELALTRTVTRTPDFIEGVRAVLVDKDNRPQWTPPTIEAMDRASVLELFPPEA